MTAAALAYKPLVEHGAAPSCQLASSRRSAACTRASRSAASALPQPRKRTRPLRSSRNTYLHPIGRQGRSGAVFRQTNGPQCAAMPAVRKFGTCCHRGHPSWALQDTSAAKMGRFAEDQAVRSMLMSCTL